MAQSVEHVLGKDGVGSSNLPISSKKTAQKGGFLLFSLRFSTGNKSPTKYPKILLLKNP